MIVITNPSAVANEISIIESLFEEGLSLLHIRKPNFSELEMALFIHQIDLEYRNKLVLHNHHILSDDFGINRIHLSEKQRISKAAFPARFAKSYKYNSTSTHSIEDFNGLGNHFEYAFLSPVFKSISKENYYPSINLFEALKLRTNANTKVIALGGIESKNIAQVLENGFDDIALLGTIWNNDNPVKQFKLCQKIAHTYFL
jgi:thiamine-phosphate pyrophosphorylase